MNLIRNYILPAWAAVCLLLAPTAGWAQCAGDCSGDGTVTVDEIVRGVGIALGNVELERCPVFDSSMDGAVTVDELVRAIQFALDGCPVVPTATATVPAATATATPTEIPSATAAPTDSPTAIPSPTSPPANTPTNTPPNTPTPPVVETATLPPLESPTPTATATATSSPEAQGLGALTFSTTNGDNCDTFGSCPSGCGVNAGKSCFLLNPVSANQCCGTSNTHWNAASSTAPNIFLTGGVPDANGRASLTLSQPVVIGDFKATTVANGYACWRIRQDPAFATSADSFVDCDGGTRANVTLSIDSHGTAANGEPSLTVDSSADAAAPAGAAVIRILMQSGETATDTANCDTVDWNSIPDQAIALATGTVNTTILNPRPSGTASATLRGDPFNCATWSSGGAQGSLVFPLYGLDQMIPLFGTKDVANAIRMKD